MVLPPPASRRRATLGRGSAHPTAHHCEHDWPSPRLSCPPPGTGTARTVRTTRLGRRGQLEAGRPPRARRPGRLRDIPPAGSGPHQRRGWDRLAGHEAVVGNLVLRQLHPRRRPLHIHGPDPAGRRQLARGCVQRRIPHARCERWLLHPGPDDHSAACRSGVLRDLPEWNRHRGRLGNRRQDGPGRGRREAEPQAPRRQWEAGLRHQCQRHD